MAKLSSRSCATCCAGGRALHGIAIEASVNPRCGRAPLSPNEGDLPPGLRPRWQSRRPWTPAAGWDRSSRGWPGTRPKAAQTGRRPACPQRPHTRDPSRGSIDPEVGVLEAGLGAQLLRPERRPAPGELIRLAFSGLGTHDPHVHHDPSSRHRTRKPGKPKGLSRVRHSLPPPPWRPVRQQGSACLRSVHRSAVS
jgi:hypothetical protein